MSVSRLPILYFRNTHEHASLHTGLFRDYLHSGYPYVTPSVTFASGSLSSSVFNVIAIGNNAFDPGQRSFTVGFELPDIPNLDLRKGRSETLKVSITDDDSEWPFTACI